MGADQVIPVRKNLTLVVGYIRRVTPAVEKLSLYFAAQPTCAPLCSFRDDEYSNQLSVVIDMASPNQGFR